MASRKRSADDEKIASKRRPARPASSKATPQGQEMAAELLAPRTRVDPPSLSPHDVLRLQRTIGNQATGRLLRQPDQSQSGTPDLVIQRTIDDDIGALETDLETFADDELLSNILREILAVRQQANVEVKHGPSDQESHVQPKGKHGVDRAYEVVIDAKQITDPVQRQSYIIHELTHVSSDQKYEINRALGETMFNVIHDARKKDPKKYVGEQMDYLFEQIGELRTVVDKEKGTLGAAVYSHLCNRLPRAQVSAVQEFDTIMSELLYYLTKKNVDRETETYQKVRSLAEKAYKSRNEGAPILPKKKPCFLTTACTVAHGLPDDCEELTVLRAFRDSYMESQDGGPGMIEEYYRIAPAIVAAIGARDDAAEIYGQLFGEIQRCVTVINGGDPHSAFETYRDTVLELRDCYLPETGGEPDDLPLVRCR